MVYVGLQFTMGHPCWQISLTESSVKISVIESYSVLLLQKKHDTRFFLFKINKSFFVIDLSSSVCGEKTEDLYLQQQLVRTRAQA